MEKLIWEVAMVLEHTRVLRNMGTCFLLKLEGYGDEYKGWKLNPKASLLLNLGVKGGVWDELE